MLKQLFLFTIISVLLSCSSQDAILEVNTFKEFNITAGLSTLEAHYFTRQNIPILFETQTNNSNIPIEDISSFTPSRANLVPGNGLNFDLSFIRSVNVFLLDPDDPEKRFEIFYMDLVEPGEKSEIRLFNNITDLKDILENDRANIGTRLEFYSPPPSSFDFRLNMTFAVFTS